jgi:tetratricopeptide (TPR) repeat protein
MKNLVMMLMAATLLISAAPYGRTDPTPNAAKGDKLAAAKKAEERGDLARVHQNYPLATGYYLAALKVSHQDAMLYNKLGIAELQMSERGAARKNFNAALRIDSKFTPAMNNLGATALLDKKYRIAADYFKQALAMDESVASTHLNLAEAWVGLNEMERAMTEYARALELDADLLSNSGDGIIARVATPEQRARIAFFVAKSYAKRGNVEGALDYLGRAKGLNFPDLGRVYSDTDFSSVWNDPRLEKIVKRPRS